MSREIKFRMWDFENEQMIDGDSLAFEEYAPISHLLSQKGIMQYTGLKDKNGKQIYEGDIADDGRGNMAVIEWAQDHCQFLWMYEGDVQEIGEWCEVIGNIYANPELLEDKHE